jgi:hypothetical protein
VLDKNIIESGAVNSVAQKVGAGMFGLTGGRASQLGDRNE